MRVSPHHRQRTVSMDFCIPRDDLHIPVLVHAGQEGVGRFVDEDVGTSGQSCPRWSRSRGMIRNAGVETRASLHNQSERKGAHTFQGPAIGRIAANDDLPPPPRRLDDVSTLWLPAIFLGGKTCCAFDCNI